jgi:hypothetical protein
MEKRVQFRQGDVLIERIERIPVAAVKQPARERIILAYGEATGHHHSLDIGAADWWKLGEEQFLDVAGPAPAKVVHQEHHEIELPAGRYRVTRQREYSPERIRNVAD